MLGGKKSLHFWSGSKKETHGHKRGGAHPILGDFNVAVPSYDTLRRYLPTVRPYTPITQQAAPRIISFVNAYKRGTNWTYNGTIPVFFTVDEISLRAGLVWSKKFGAVGLVDGPLTFATFETLRNQYPDWTQGVYC